MLLPLCCRKEACEGDLQCIYDNLSMVPGHAEPQEEASPMHMCAYCNLCMEQLI